MQQAALLSHSPPEDRAMNALKPLTICEQPSRRQRRCAGAPAAIAAIALLITAAGCSKDEKAQQGQQAPDSSPVLARVDGSTIRQSDVALAEEDLGNNAQQMTEDQKRDYIVTYLVDVNLISKAAEAKKLGDSDEFNRRLAFYRKKLLMELLLQSEAKAAITDAAMQETYQEAVKQFGKEEEVRARHILLEKEDDAWAVLDELKKGGDFGELAKKHSKDPGAANGGDLGYFTKDQMVPEFAEVAFKLGTGQMSGLVKTPFGWHIIKVEDKRTKQAPEFDKVKDQIEAFIVRKTQAELVAKLREAAKIERLDKKAEQPKPVLPAPGGATKN
jgi:peptidyl-prolyl cis-trans isomerase C